VVGQPFPLATAAIEERGFKKGEEKKSICVVCRRKEGREGRVVAVFLLPSQRRRGENNGVRSILLPAAELKKEKGRGKSLILSSEREKKRWRMSTSRRS